MWTNLSKGRSYIRCTCRKRYVSQVAACFSSRKRFIFFWSVAVIVWIIYTWYLYTYDVFLCYVFYLNSWYCTSVLGTHGAFQDFNIQKKNSTFKYHMGHMYGPYGHILEIQEGVKTATKTEPRCKVFDFIQMYILERVRILSGTYEMYKYINKFSILQLNHHFRCGSDSF